MSMIVLDALLSIGDRLDSQVIGRTENLGGSARESSPYLFSLDLVSFRAPICLQTLNINRQEGYQTDEKKKFAYQKEC